MEWGLIVQSAECRMQSYGEFSREARKFSDFYKIVYVSVSVSRIFLSTVH